MAEYGQNVSSSYGRQPYLPIVLHHEERVLKNRTIINQDMLPAESVSIHVGANQDDSSVVKTPMPWSGIPPVTVGGKMMKKHWLPTNHKYDIGISADDRDAHDSEGETDVQHNINR